MNWFKEAMVIIFNESKKSKAIKVSISTLIAIMAAVFFLAKPVWFYKGQIEKIPGIEKKVQEHEEVIKIIPDMKDDIKWLVRSRGGIPAEEKRIRRGQ
jgi:hypothetical protein